MTTRKMLIIFSVVIIIALACFYGYLVALGSMWSIKRPDKNTFFFNTKPILVKNMILPNGAKILYERQYFWQSQQQEQPLKETDIIQISLMEGTTINWAGVPITSIVRFYNSKMKGFTVHADFSKLNAETGFSHQWQNCNEDYLGITVKNTNDWSFNKDNIVDVESCGVNY